MAAVIDGLREVFEAARRAVGLREGCTYDDVIAGIAELKAERDELQAQRDRCWDILDTISSFVKEPP